MASKFLAKEVAAHLGFASLPDEVIRELDRTVYNMLEDVVETAKVVMENSKKRRMSASDVSYALRIKNDDPIAEYSCPEWVPFRLAVTEANVRRHGGGPKMIDVDEMIESPPPSTSACMVQGHWLAIEGVQPLIAENPSPDDIAFRPVLKLSESERTNLDAQAPGTVVSADLSTAHLLYFKDITDACVGKVESKRCEALQNLSSLTGVNPVLPQLVTFIKEGVACCVSEGNIIMLTYLMRMINALNSNLQISLELYLHNLLPCVLSCVVGRRLCTKADADNQWGLRQYAGNLLIQMCRRYSNSNYCLQYRITDYLARQWTADDAPMAVSFGAVYTLANVGPDAIRHIILPNLPRFGEDVRRALESGNAVERAAAEQVKRVVLQLLAKYRTELKPVPTTLEQYVELLGDCFGAAAYGNFQRADNKQP